MTQTNQRREGAITHKNDTKSAVCNIYVTDLPSRLRELAAAIKACDWELPITATYDCQAAAEEIEAWRGKFPTQEICTDQENDTQKGN